jgi:hypothetical protein
VNGRKLTQDQKIVLAVLDYQALSAEEIVRNSGGLLRFRKIYKLLQAMQERVAASPDWPRGFTTYQDIAPLVWSWEDRDGRRFYQGTNAGYYWLEWNVNASQ